MATPEKLPLDSSDFEIVGTGPIGDKAQQLIRKSAPLREAGFEASPRLVLAQSVLDDFIRTNGLGENLVNMDLGEDWRENLRASSWAPEIIAKVASFCQTHGDVPYMFRSSAEGDSMGTGIYESWHAGSDSDDIKNTLSAVLASYWSHNAIAFRRDAQLPHGFAIMIEPVIGQLLQDSDYDGEPEEFAPLLSGHGYTSTVRGGALIRFVFGLGCGVSTKNTAAMTRSDLEGIADTYAAFSDSRYDQFSSKARRAARISTHDVPTFGRQGDRWVDRVPNLSYDPNISWLLHDFSFSQLFDRLEALEQACGKPQYVEWAVTRQSDQPKLWIIQISDMNYKRDIVESITGDTVIIQAHTVVGRGSRTATECVYCRNSDDIVHLSEYSKTHKDFILIYNSSLTSGASWSYRKMDYSNVAGAAVLLEIDNMDHGFSSHPISHFGGALDMTNKLFGVIGKQSPWWERLQDLAEEAGDTLPIIKGNFLAVGDKAKDTLQVYLNKNPA